MVFVLVIVYGFFAWRTHGTIAAPMNITSLVAQNAYVFILAVGMLLCILTGGNIDLSVGSVVCFTGAIGAMCLVGGNLLVRNEEGLPLPVVVIIMLGVGILIGAFQGFWIAYVRIPPFIVTLAGMLAFRGLSNVLLDGKGIPLADETSFMKIFGGGNACYVPDLFNMGIYIPSLNIVIKHFNLTCFIIGIVAVLIFLALEVRSRLVKKKKGYETDKLWAFILKNGIIAAAIIWVFWKFSCDKGLPNVLIILMVVILFYGYLTGNTTIGRSFYAVGGNEKATKLSGINTNKVYFIAYTNMGLLSAVAALVTMARLSSAQPTAGNSYEMDAIGSCFIGGASAYGGIGTVPGVIIGAILMGVINMGMQLMSVDQNMCKVVKGGVLLAAVIFDVVSKRRGKFIAKN
ncbi:MAG: sugar ABC transporter permease [Clostridiales bacterium]|nr:sugar ABC transporter permease [Clostridiales bacterium]